MIPNFGIVENGVYRGGQPSTVADWNHLIQLGITQVIKLNTDHPEDGGPDYLPAGFEQFLCPISMTQQVLTEPDKQAINDVLGFIKPETFIHCFHGQDRTGLVVAMYRVKTCGWTKDEAEAEMLEYGFHKWLLGLWLFWKEWQP